jgi:hypothetical protein
MANRVTGIRAGAISVVRSASGVIAADSATLTDANISPTMCVDCQGLRSVLVGVEITAGTSPTMTIEALFRDADAPDGSRYKRLLHGPRDGETTGAAAALDTGALDGTSFRELLVFGWQSVFFRITAVANSASTTAWKILVVPGEVMPQRQLVQS